MSVLISGLDHDACAQLFGADWPHLPLRWMAPEDFLRDAQTVEPRSGAGAGERLLWLYRPPWALPTTAQVDAEPGRAALGLGGWYQQQRAALALRRTLGERMLLVNAERAAGPELAFRLGLTASRVDRAISEQPAPEPQRRFDGAVEQGLAKLFEWSLPHYWDLFEDLEAVAWLPAGEPLFRRDLQPVSVEGIEQLLGSLQQGLQVPQWRSELERHRQSAASLQQRVREAETAAQREQQTLAELRESMTRRIAELEQRLEQGQAEQTATAAERDSSQRELREQQSRSLELERALTETRSALEQAQQDVADAQSAKAASESAQQAAAAHAQALGADIERLQGELHQLRDTHEGQMAANRELRARLARSTETLDRARVQLCRQLARMGLSAP